MVEGGELAPKTVNDTLGRPGGRNPSGPPGGQGRGAQFPDRLGPRRRPTGRGSPRQRGRDMSLASSDGKANG
jgi:hypothetical protein